MPQIPRRKGTRRENALLGYRHYFIHSRGMIVVSVASVNPSDSLAFKSSFIGLLFASTIRAGETEHLDI